MRNLQSLKLICPCENGGFFSLITFIFSPNSLIFSNVIICCSHSLLWFYPLWSLLLYIYILSFKNFQQFFSVYISAEIFHLSSDFSNINVRPSNILQTSEVLFILFNFFFMIIQIGYFIRIYFQVHWHFSVSSLFFYWTQSVNFFRYFDFSSGVFLFSFFFSFSFVCFFGRFYFFAANIHFFHSLQIYLPLSHRA